MNKVKVGFFSFTEVTDPSEHHAYNEWHQLDHLPEQLPLPGVAHGERWVSSPACRATREAVPPLDRVHYVTCYLMTDPVEQTLRDFRDLGARLHAAGRFHHHRASHLSGPFLVAGEWAAPRVRISAAAVPWRPHRGVLVVVDEVPDGTDPAAVDAHLAWLDQEHVPTALAVPGVAGVWSFGPGPGLARQRTVPDGVGADLRVRVYWLDGEPDTTAAAVLGAAPPAASAPVRCVYAGALETIAPGEWGWFDGP
jgi:hypothetical protein